MKTKLTDLLAAYEIFLHKQRSELQAELKLKNLLTGGEVSAVGPGPVGSEVNAKRLERQRSLNLAITNLLSN